MRGFIDQVPGAILAPGLRETTMGEFTDKLDAAGNKIAGNIKEAIGKATGDAKLQSDGKADKVEGTVQNAIGGVRDTVRDALSK